MPRFISTVKYCLNAWDWWACWVCFIPESSQMRDTNILDPKSMTMMITIPAWCYPPPPDHRHDYIRQSLSRLPIIAVDLHPSFCSDQNVLVLRFSREYSNGRCNDVSNPKVSQWQSRFLSSHASQCQKLLILLFHKKNKACNGVTMKPCPGGPSYILCGSALVILLPHAAPSSMQAPLTIVNSFEWHLSKLRLYPPHVNGLRRH